MAHDLDEHFSTVFTMESTTTVPLTENSFKDTDSEYLGELIVTPSIVTEQTDTLWESKSSGQNGIQKISWGNTTT